MVIISCQYAAVPPYAQLFPDIVACLACAFDMKMLYRTGEHSGDVHCI